MQIVYILCNDPYVIMLFQLHQSQVTRVNYPGLPGHADHALAQRQMVHPGGMLSFELGGGFEAARQFMDQLGIASVIPTLGNVDTLVSHPASMSHQNMPAEVRRQNGISDGLVRLSAGIENIADLLEDIDNALA